MSALGFCINRAPAQAPTELTTSFRTVATPRISDAMNRVVGATGLKMFHRAGRMAGTAFTVKTRPGDNLMIHKALDLARPGDVIVVDGGGDPNNALVGELMLRYAIVRGLNGFVIDGAIRDVSAFRMSDFPCFARGIVHRGPYKQGPGEINVPVSIGGLVIAPGDIVVGDEDGLVAFAQEQGQWLLEQAIKAAEEEERTKEEIAAGNFRRPFVNEVLREKGVI